MPSPKRGKLQKILTLELEFQPTEAMTQKVLDFLKENAVNKAAPELERVAYRYARAAGLFGHSLDPQTGDVHINADHEHQARMEPIRELRALAQRMAELFEHPHIKTTAISDASFVQSVGGILRASSMVEKALDRNHERFLPSAEKQEGDPKRARYGLYVAVEGCWLVCKKSEVPARKREGGGPFADFAKGLLALAPDTKRNVSTDELHRSILGLIDREAKAPGPVFGVTRL